VIYELQDNGTRVEEKPEPIAAPEVLAGYEEATTDEEKVELLNAAAEAMVKHTEEMVESGHLPTPAEKPVEKPVEKTAEPKTQAQKVAEKIKAIIPTDKPVEDDLDSVYEGRASTPKSSKKTKTKPRRAKKGKSKS
jgi:hypothetical protein